MRWFHSSTSARVPKLAPSQKYDSLRIPGPKNNVDPAARKITVGDQGPVRPGAIFSAQIRSTKKVDNVVSEPRAISVSRCSPNRNSTRAMITALAPFPGHRFSRLKLPSRHSAARRAPKSNRGLRLTVGIRDLLGSERLRRSRVMRGASRETAGTKENISAQLQQTPRRLPR
jgi:hypothetical protein